MDATLRVLSGPHAGETIAIRRGKLLIGREEDCHLRPESEFVSRHHCVLLLDDYTLRIRDLGSKNGTFVNGRRVGSGETILLHDDTISIGEMIGQIDLTPAVVAVDPAVIAAGQHNTGVFEGDTVQAGTAEPDTNPETPVAAPVIPDLTAAEANSDTRTSHPPSA
ncbi:MAG TPA: FHA domain-containing protein [Planctomycetaceae bacterium]|jgi:predicted component of type VI protein secretion system|nr:FHA domain-containing protein [Planctomycetaceae bacterium]